MMPSRRRFSVGMPQPERPSRGRRLVFAALLVLAVVALARLMLRIAQVPTEPVPEERIIEIR
jgi:hypothetical protein